MRTILVFTCIGFFLPGCQTSRPRTAAVTARAVPAATVLDYRWGWYHPSDGQLDIESIARHYHRDPALVAQLNRMSLSDRPATGKMLYIPPNNDRDYVRRALLKINEDPSLVPHKPWEPEKVLQVADLPPGLKILDTPLKARIAQSPVIAVDPTVDVASATDAASSGAPLKQSSSYKAVQTAAARPAPSSLIVERKARPSVSASTMIDTGNLLAKASSTARTRSGGMFDWPAEGEVVTPFSEGWTKACHGVEIATEPNAPIHAAREGKVLLAQKFPGYGQLILIDHGNGFASAYAYVAEMKVKENDRVSRGQVIASVGGKYASSPLLFFQIRRNGQKVDPMEYLDR